MTKSLVDPIEIAKATKPVAETSSAEVSRVQQCPICNADMTPVYSMGLDAYICQTHRIVNPALLDTQ